MLDKKSSFFSSDNPTFVFVAGLVIGILILGTIGFFILLAKTMGNDSPKSAGGNNQVVNNQPSNGQPNQPTKVADLTILESDHVRGNRNAKVKIFEFSDYECPYCGSFHPTMQQVMDQYGDQVAWIYRHFPLDSLHPQARPSAEAAECVAEQAGDEGFWQFTDALFANQQSLSSTLYQQVAQSLGLNMNQFNDCVSSGKYQDKVESDYQSGVLSGVTGTPGSFINGIPVKGALPFSTIKQIIDSEL
ncbi:MAG: hypothetical protein COU22_00800 [Candidatus Komeilibacteria bacterium CG10_big_fil_rev_8_21_14_0_10_41_13]|uniref:Thioredoxin domain-containing protein n=1 Tax=Candidatus Komeilibacteria bacterium CG10_big_fil_rev_8_21_14_0_10_41_13 TaxID=1974476 RepID=A0A2M6WD63_9BACT|nr:MAG: hypothetical protein COU22_00800 [Candidatus Komeilibacteria bacterium CG10_big_fil_rev_8_21_14_0_10_41_13]